MKLVLNDNVIIEETMNYYFIRTEYNRLKILKSKMSECFIKKIRENDFYIDIKSYSELGDMKFLGKLIENHILVEDINKDNENYSNRKFLSYFTKNIDEILNKISEKVILILGVGGVGQLILQHLVASGFKKFVLVDFDTVNIKNMNRQFLLRRNQVGKDKVDAVAYNIEKDYPDIEIKKIVKRITSVEEFDDIIDNCYVDMLVCCADHPSNTDIRKIVTEKSIRINRPCAFAGVGIKIGEIGPILYTADAKEKYILDISRKREKVIFDSILSGSICYTNTLVSAMLGYEIFKYYSGIERCNILNKGIFYNIEDYSIIKEQKW